MSSKVSRRDREVAPTAVSILIVDDNDKQLLALESILEGLDLNVVAVTSGRAALKELLHHSFALVLLDVNLPGLDGFEIAALMRQRPQCQSTPIIFMTAYGDDVYVERGYSLGAVDFMLTPIVPEVLRTKVSVFINLHRQAEQLRRQAHHLEHRASQLAALARQLTIAEERERRRVAGLLHDDIQQLLAGSLMLARHASERHPDAAPALRDLQDVVKEALEASRSLARQISPPSLRNGGLAAATAEAAQRFEKQHGIPCRIDLPDRLPRLNEALEAFLYHALGELLLNVAKHARARHVTIAAAVAPRALTVEVRDDGVGFPGGHPGQVSDFGLHSIRQRLELFEGSLGIRCGESKGSVVSLELPLENGNVVCEPVRSVPEIEAPVPAARQVVRLLIVDDHEMIRRGLRAMLAGAEDVEVVGEADNGSEAVRQVRSLEPHVVLMDMFMPDGDGLAATRDLVAARAPAQVVAMSTSPDEGVVNALLEAGAVGFLSKTCTAEQLVTAIRNATPRG